MVKRLRVFAGPNGSGKSTFIKEFPDMAPNLKLGVYVNADDIESELKKSRQINISSYKLAITTKQIQEYFRHSKFAPVKLHTSDLWKSFTVKDHLLYVKSGIDINSYIAADLAEFLRQEILKSGLSFSFETVMSAPEKIDFLKLAADNGYKVYLYFFCTKDPIININRVKLRVTQNGHDVDEKLIKSRYIKSLENLKEAIRPTYRAYLFDNSQISRLVAEITGGKKVQIVDEKNIPKWVIDYLV